ncbi:MAG: response regulator [Actinomycetota bacterium]
MATVLTVDDDLVARVLLRHLLDQLGHDVIEAENGREALDLFETRSVDLVLSDQDMPGLTGLELRAALGDRLDVPFVLLTGYADRDELGAGQVSLDAVDAFLTKPISSKALAEVIAALLTDHRLN